MNAYILWPTDLVIWIHKIIWIYKNPTQHCRARNNPGLLLLQSFLDLHPNIDITDPSEPTLIPLDGPHLPDIIGILLVNNYTYPLPHPFSHNFLQITFLSSTQLNPFPQPFVYTSVNHSTIGLSSGNSLFNQSLLLLFPSPIKLDCAICFLE